MLKPLKFVTNDTQRADSEAGRMLMRNLFKELYVVIWTINSRSIENWVLMFLEIVVIFVGHHLLILNKLYKLLDVYVYMVLQM